uniref:Uncharacterized protein n=1 Tax=Ditylenchus dipsaci TaxID=166011 RepID=A0A915E6W1_9BILA
MGRAFVPGAKLNIPASGTKSSAEAVMGRNTLCLEACERSIDREEQSANGLYLLYCITCCFGGTVESGSVRHVGYLSSQAHAVDFKQYEQEKEASEGENDPFGHVSEPRSLTVLWVMKQWATGGI